MTYTPDPARVRELAERLIVHRASGPDTAADALGYDSTIPENDTLSDDDWGVLMAAVDQAAKSAKISVRFPESEPDEAAPATVHVTVHGGPPPRGEINRQLLAEYRAYPHMFRR